MDNKLDNLEEHGIHLLDNFLTGEDCDEMIQFIKKKLEELEKAGIYGHKEWNVNGEIIVGYGINRFFENEKIRSCIEKKINDKFPQRLKKYNKNGTLYRYWGLGDRMSMIYYKNGKIDKHKDKSYYKDLKRGVLTLLIYFNDNYEGGETVFYPNPKNLLKKIVVTPKRGSACIFDMDLEHECYIVKGEKYALNLKLSYECI